MYALEIIVNYVDNNSFAGLECGPQMTDTYRTRFFRTKRAAKTAAENWLNAVVRIAHNIPDFDCTTLRKSGLWREEYGCYPLQPAPQTMEEDINSGKYIQYSFSHLHYIISTYDSLEFNVYKCIPEE